MARPWFWNLVLLLAVAMTAGKTVALLGRSTPSLPEPPVLSGEARSLPLPAPPPEAETYDEIGERNLFSPDRGKAQTVAVAAPTVDARAGKPPEATLFGVVIEESGDKYAFIKEAAQQAGTKPKKYREGDWFAGGRVTSIQPDRVTLTVGASDFTLALRTPKAGLDPGTRAPPPVRPPERTVSPRPVRRSTPQLSAPSRRPRPATVRRSRRAVQDARRQPPRPSYRRPPVGGEYEGEWGGDPESPEDFYPEDYEGEEGEFYYEDENDPGYEEQQW